MANWLLKVVREKEKVKKKKREDCYSKLLKFDLDLGSFHNGQILRLFCLIEKNDLKMGKVGVYIRFLDIYIENILIHLNNQDLKKRLKEFQLKLGELIIYLGH